MFPWLEILFAIQLSTITAGQSEVGISTQKTSINIETQHAVTVEAEALFFDVFYIDFGTKTKVTDTTNLTYYPYSVSSKFGFGLYLFDSIKVGFNHVCIHPQIPWDYEVNHPLFNASYDEVYIRAEFTLK